MKNNNKPIVAISRCSRYKDEEVHRALQGIFEPFGGFKALVAPGQKVLLKPNLLAAAAPAEAVTTHPMVVKAMAELVHDAGGMAYIGDSPGWDSQEYAHRVAGYTKVMEETGAKMLLLKEVKEVAVRGFKEWSVPLAAELDQVDLIINLAKLKTHALTGLTAAVKNTYGCIPGKHKKRFHMENPLPSDFSKLVVDICLAVKPAFSIIDAVVAMEEMGPRNGKARQAGLLLGSNNPFALDAVAAEITGFLPEQAATVAAARKLKLSGSNLDDIDFPGLKTAECRLQGFNRGLAAKGRLSDLITNLPLVGFRYLRYSRRPYPQIDRERCSSCGDCIEICPVQIIRLEGGIPDIDHDQCIRCYCCQELCPEGAIKLKSKKQLK